MINYDGYIACKFVCIYCYVVSIKLHKEIIKFNFNILFLVCTYVIKLKFVCVNPINNSNA